jgi:hypothetical protein
VTIAPLARSPLINRGRFPLVICRFLPLKRQGGSTTIRKNWLAPSCTVPDSDAGTARVPLPAARKSILSDGMANKEGGADFSRQRPWVVTGP